MLVFLTPFLSVFAGLFGPDIRREMYRLEAKGKNLET